MKAEKHERQDIFDPYEKLIEIFVDGRILRVPENNSILRCFQYVAMEEVSEAELCWNGDCQNCMVRITVNDDSRSVMACRTKAVPGMHVTDLSRELGTAMSAKTDNGNALSPA